MNNRATNSSTGIVNESSVCQRADWYQLSTIFESLDSTRKFSLCLLLVVMFGCNGGSSSNKDDNEYEEDSPIDDPEGDVPEPIEVIGISLGEISGNVHAVMAMDTDNDGDLDIIATSVNKAYVYENVSLNGSPDFASPALYAEFSNISRYRIIVDMDSDGDFDAISTVAGNRNRSPSVVYEENIGSNEQPEFNATDLLARNECSGDWIMSDMSNDDIYMALADIDGDGDFDLFIGEKGGDMVTTDIGYCENIGNASAPEYAKAATPNPFGLQATNGSNYIAFGDMDDDGDIDAWTNHDIAESNHQGDYYVYENIGTVESALFQRIASESEGTHGFPVQGCQHPAFADFDDDGDLDGVCGDGINVKYLENNQ